MTTGTGDLEGGEESESVSRDAERSSLKRAQVSLLFRHCGENVLCHTEEEKR